MLSIGACVQFISVCYCHSVITSVTTDMHRLTTGIRSEKCVVRRFRRCTWGPGSVVGIATAYGLDGPGIESPVGGEIFRIRLDQTWGPPSLLYNWYRVFAGGKAARAWRRPPTTSNAEVKERVELYLHYTSEPSWPVLGELTGVLISP